jgi:hypothetical protein
MVKLSQHNSRDDADPFGKYSKGYRSNQCIKLLVKETTKRKHTEVCQTNNTTDMATIHYEMRHTNHAHP